MVAAFIDSSENMTLGYSPLQNAAAPASRSKSASAAATAQNASEGQNAPETEKPHRGLFGPEGFTFAAFLDIINPLQHIPVVNSIYRAVTGDTIENGSRIIGGALFGGPIGLVASVINGIVDEETGKDIGSHALAAIGIDDGMGRDPSVGLAQKAPDTATETALAQAQNAPQYQQLAQNAPQYRQMAQNAPQDMARQNGPQQRLPQNGAQDEPALGALAALTARSWGEAQQTAAEAPAAAARDGGIPFNQITASQAPASQAAANNGRDARGGERQWFSTQTNQGGVVQRSVGAQPVTAASVSQKFGVARGMAHASAAPRPGPQPVPENLPQQLPNIPQVPADFAERANAAYQKYLDMKQTDGSRRAVDQSF